MGGRDIWNGISAINSGIKGIAYPLLTLFFIIGFVKVSTSYMEVKKPEHIFKEFLRLVLAKLVIDKSMDFLQILVEVSIGTVSKITGAQYKSLNGIPEALQTEINNANWFTKIICIIVAIIIALIIIALSIGLLITVYGRFFEIYIYMAIAPIPLSCCGSQEMEHHAKHFVMAFFSVCFEGAVIALAFAIFNLFQISGGMFGTQEGTLLKLMVYGVQTIMNMVILQTVVKGAEGISRKIFGI